MDRNDTYTVLTVDDEYLILRSIAKLIESSSMPFSVVGEAEDGLEALELANRLHPDIIIADIRMPVMDGLEFMEQVRTSGSKAEFIILSGYDEFQFAQQAMRLGAVDYLLKPVRRELLEHALIRVYDKLQNDKANFWRQSEWVRYCQEKARKLAEQIWLVNEQGAFAEAEALFRKSGLPPDPSAALRYLCLMVMECVVQELETRGLTDPEWRREPETQLPLNKGLLQEVFTGWIADLLERTRQNRNWGALKTASKAAEYMERHFHVDTLSLQDVAEYVGISPSYLSRTFKEEIGMSFVRYLTRLRMEQAMRLLQTPGSRTTEVAESVGYKDYFHFAKTFKKYTGFSASEYKKRFAATGN